MFTTFILNFHEAAQKLVFEFENCHLKTGGKLLLENRLKISKSVNSWKWLKLVATNIAV